MKKFFTILEIKRTILSFGKVAIIGSLLVFMAACMNSKDEVVCTVGSHELTEEKLVELIQFENGNIEDEKLRNKLIDNWAERKLIEIEISEKLPEAYANNLIKSEHEANNLHLFELENEYIRTHLDSTVSEDQIQEYYKKHRENYKASSFIVKALYIKILDTLNNEGKLQKHFLLKNDKDYSEIKKYGNLYATNFYLEKDRWIYFDDLVKEIPMSQKQKEELIKNRGEAIFEIDGYTYFINVLDYRSKTISSPMEVEKSIIRAHILKRRVHQLREKAKETILKDVKENNPVTYY
tara:strand:- start:44960 stop:45841 length:882 start_codon:yes stop_codon:yes gene_type:complete